MPTFGAYQHEIEDGIKVIRAGLDVAAKGQLVLHSNQIETKNDGTPVSICDFACQMVIMNGLNKYFPGDQIFAEENLNHEACFIEEAKKLLPGEYDIQEICKKLSSKLNDGRVWVVDPIDGTAGFIRGGNFAVSMALLVDKKVVASVVGWSKHSEEYTGIKVEGPVIFVSAIGHGAFAVDKDDNFIKLENKHNAKNIITFSQNTKPREDNIIEAIKKKMNIKGELRMHSMTKGFVLAAGGANSYLRIRCSGDEWVWDIAPFELLVREAGGFSTTWDGKEIAYTSEGKCYNSNGGLIFSFVDEEFHKKLLKAYMEEKMKY